MKSLPLLKQGAPTDIPQHHPSAGGAAPRMLVVPRLQRSTILAIRLPALPGWADVWLPALRAWVRFAVYFRVLTHPLQPVRKRLKAGTALAAEGTVFPLEPTFRQPLKSGAGTA